MPTINQWNKGIVNDPRTHLTGVSRMLSRFDIYSNSNQLVPNPSTEDGNNGDIAKKLTNFAIGDLGGTQKLFGLGVVSGTGKASVYMKSLSQGASQDLDDDVWGQPANNDSSSGAVNPDLFIWYERTGKLYGARAGQYIWATDPGASWDDSERDLGSFDNYAQGLVHSKDDILYIPYDNKIAKNNNGSWTSPALTLPEEFYITSICEYGNYLAIGVAPVTPGGKSKVYLWDRDATLETLSESIDFGGMELKIIENIGGYLIGISNSNKGYQPDEVVFSVYSGGTGAKEYLRLTGINDLEIDKQKGKFGNKVFFLMKGTINGTYRSGLWSFGKTGINTPFTLAHEYSQENDTEIQSGLYGFFILGKYIFISYVDSEGNHAIQKTDNDGNTLTYSATSTWETTLNPSMEIKDRGKNKQLKGTRLIFEPLQSSNEIKLYYRADGGSWAEIFTESNSSESFQIIEKAKDVNGSNFSEAREYDFKVESKGVALIELFYTYDIIKTQL